jgi:hypothetical protein
MSDRENGGVRKMSGIEKYLGSGSGLIKHALAEFRYAGWMDGNNEFLCDEGEPGFSPQETMCLDVLELLEVFGKQGHSGHSAGYLLSMFEKLARYRPLSPVKGNDDEWVEVARGIYQNKRCSHVFKDVACDGQAYDTEAVIFRRKDGSCYTSKDSLRPVTFPYTPVREYVDVDEEEEA